MPIKQTDSAFGKYKPERRRFQWTKDSIKLCRLYVFGIRSADGPGKCGMAFSSRWETELGFLRGLNGYKCGTFTD
ncbi:MAG: hypothetical protein FWG83_02500 [Oscillospiraceae bacterium]|nr:hypothetical protein [Oscillospiraceae bacterium]